MKFVEWLNKVYSEFLILKGHPNGFIKYEETPRKLLWFNLKPKLTPVSVDLPTTIAPMVNLYTFTNGSLKTPPFFYFKEKSYNCMPELVALINSDICWLDGEMLLVYNKLRGEYEKLTNKAH